MVSSNLFFNLPNLIYWLALALVVWVEAKLVGERWPERWRWLLGYVTLFGSGLVMALAFGWDWLTWLGLLAAVGLARLVKAERLLVGSLWERPNRESHRWTAQYFAAFLFCIPMVALGCWDILTWAGLFFGLGLCGAVKVGWGAYLNSRRAQQLRLQTQTVEVDQDGPTPGH